MFNHNITSIEPNIKDILEELSDHKNELFDFRPYMIHNPVKVSQYSYLEEALTLFRLHHLSHLLVVNPADNSLVGIITRKDLDAFMNY